MPYINVNDAYILDNTGKQVDDAVDYALYNSNRNLLDNPRWGSGEVVNQRSFTSGDTAGYAIDRWLIGGGTGTIALTANGLQFTVTSGNQRTFRQHLPLTPFAAKAGQTFTASLLMSDGTILSGQFVMQASGLNANMYFSYGGGQIRVNPYTTADQFRLQILAYVSCTIRAVKLELGSYSTLANDVPPDYGEELRKCMRYFVRVQSKGSFMPYAYGYATNATTLRVFIPLPVTMRGNPKIAITGTSQIIGNASSISVTGFDQDGLVYTGGVGFAVTVASGLTQQMPYVWATQGSDSYIDLSADL